MFVSIAETTPIPSATTEVEALRRAPVLSVIVPTYNEVGNVECLVRQISEVLRGLEWEVIFVDDDSPDGTARTVRHLGKEDARVRCVHRLSRRGLSTACIEGMLASSA